MAQKIKEDRFSHTHFVSFMLDKASKEDPKPQPYSHEGVDEKEVERLTREIQDKGSARRERLQNTAPKKC